MTSKVVEDAPGADDSSGGSVSWMAARVPTALWWALLELFVLTGFVVAQPLLDVTGKAPDFFLLHRADRGEILLLVALILVGPALLLWLPEVVASLVARERGRRYLHLAILAGLFALLALEAGKKLTPLRGKRLALAALIVGIGVAALYHKWSGLKLWLRYLAPAPLVFALLFATTSPSAKLILPSHQDNTAVAARVDPGKPLPPVVMVFFDEFPLNSLLDSKGQVDPAVFPSFAKFAGDATWYRNASGIAGFTPTAVPAMLSGRYPTRNLVGAAPVYQVYPDNLFTMFGHYYQLEVSETVTQLCPPAQCGQTGSPTGFKDVAKETAKLYKDIAAPTDKPVDPATIDQNPSGGTTTTDTKDPRALFSNLGQDQAARFDKFLGQIKAGDPQPTLYFLHVLMPHAPWKRLPDGRIYGDPVGRPVTAAGLWPDAVTKLNHERHLMQLAYTDTLVGKLLDRLKSQGLYDQALVLMTADHGSGFSATAKSRSLGGGDAPTLVWVPVFIKPPHQTKGRVDDRNWEQVDLLPTVSDIVGLKIPWKVDGFSELGEPKRTRTEKWWYEQPGDRRVVPGPENFRKVLQGVTDTLTRAHQNGVRGLYQFGDAADWVYKPLQQVGQVEDGDGSVTAKMKDWARFKTVKPGSNPVQSIVAGQVTSGTPPAGTMMVVAINGMVGGAGGFYPPHEGEKPTAFAAMVPDSLFTAGPGQRQIQIYLATRTGATVTFQPVGLS
jgi:Sulfatase